MKGRRGLTILELLVAMGLMTSLMLTLHAGANLSARWRRTVDEVSARARREARLTAAIAPAIRAGVVLPGLSITADGRIVDEPLPGAPISWAPPAALAIRTSSGHVLFTREGNRVLRRRIDRTAGLVDVELLAGEVTDLRFEVLGAASCASWQVRFADGGQAAGLAARRLDEPPPPPLMPRAAPRWGQEKGR